MSQFTTRKSFGPKISLTERQIERIAKRLNAAYLTCDVENNYTGSCYIMVGLPDVDGDPGELWWDGQLGDEIAKIRLSGHDPGRRVDSTHYCVGPKKMCLEALDRWIDSIIEKHSEEGKAIVGDAELI